MRCLELTVVGMQRAECDANCIGGQEQRQQRKEVLEVAVGAARSWSSKNQSASRESRESSRWWPCHTDFCTDSSRLMAAQMRSGATDNSG